MTCPLDPIATNLLQTMTSTDHSLDQLPQSPLPSPPKPFYLHWKLLRWHHCSRNSMEMTLLSETLNSSSSCSVLLILPGRLHLMVNHHILVSYPLWHHWVWLPFFMVWTSPLGFTGVHQWSLLGLLLVVISWRHRSSKTSDSCTSDSTDLSPPLSSLLIQHVLKFNKDKHVKAECKTKVSIILHTKQKLYICTFLHKFNWC